MVDKKEVEEKVGDIKETAAQKKVQAEEKVGDIKETAAQKKVQVEEKVGEIKETATQKSEDAQESAARGRTQAEKMLNDFLSTIRSRQEDFSKAISDYTTALEKPLADVIETDNEIIVKTDLPGVKKEDLDVNLTEDSVEITAKFEEEYNEEEVDYIRRERNYGETSKLIQLPAKVKVKNAIAKFENSVLTITLPKVEGEKFKVEIK